MNHLVPWYLDRSTMFGPAVAMCALIYAFFFSGPAHASLHAAMPTATISSRAAITEAAKPDVSVFRCAPMADSKGATRKAKGSKYAFTLALPAAIDDVEFDKLIASKSRPVKCVTVARNGGKWAIESEDTED